MPLNTTKLSRRGFMVGCSAAIAAMAGSRVTNLTFAAPGPSIDRPDANNYETIVVMFLRGGWDSINAVLPFAGPDRINYESARPQLKVPTANSVNGIASALANSTMGNGTSFGLHPGFAPLKDLYSGGALAIVHAAGLMNDTRSHFDAMQFMETGTPGLKTTGTGWLTRHLQSMPSAPPNLILPAVSAGSSQAMSLMGREDALSLSGVNGFDYVPWYWGEAVSNQQRGALRQMYTSGGQSWLHKAGDATLNSLETIETQTADYTPSPGAVYQQYNPLHDQLKTIAQLVKANLGLLTATIDYGGWDTHENQQYGNADPRGYFMGHLDELSRGLNAFYTDLAGSGHHTRTTLVMMSEFGRRIRENNNRGTDHGHGSVMFVLGGSVNGGKVYANWPGLGANQLYDGADLAITTDYRTVLSEILTKRAGNPNVAQVFPGYVHPGDLGIVR